MQTLDSFDNSFMGELMILDTLASTLERKYNCNCHRIGSDRELDSILQSDEKLSEYNLFFLTNLRLSILNIKPELIQK
eukprot:UN22748